MNPFLVTTNDATAAIGATQPAYSDTLTLRPSSGDVRPTRGLIFGAAGNVKLGFADGSVVTIAVPAAVLGFVQNLAVIQIYSTGTTVSAGSITALW